MSGTTYRYGFDPGVSMDDVEVSLALSRIAAEGLHGLERVRLGASYEVDKVERSCVIDGSTQVGKDIACIFSRLLLLEHGKRGFTVDRVPDGERERVGVPAGGTSL